MDNVVSEKGKTLNANAWAFTMKNRFSKDYRDEQVVKSDHKFSKLSNDDIDAEIKRIVDADQPSIKLISNE
ncbi:MAG: hypothetical protein GY938_17990 [Ketobacter sp.]|nr:hypothetical protein [Ketobacter sp.]